MADTWNLHGLNGTGIYAYMTGEIPVYNATLGRFEPGSGGGGGTGDVVGPASAVDDRIATFDGATGKIIQDGGKTIATVLSDAETTALADIAAAIGAILPIDLTSDVTGVLPAANTENTAVVPASYTNADLTVDAHGRITAAANGTPGGGTGDVTGPSASTIERIPVFADTTGKVLKDSRFTIEEVVLEAVGAAVDHLFPVLDFGFSSPVDTEFVWINQGSAAVAPAMVWGNTAISLLGTVTAGPSIRIRKKTAPATPYTITASFVPRLTSSNFAGCGLCWRDGGGQVIIFSQDSDGLVTVSKWTSATAFSAAYAGVLTSWLWRGPFVSFRITDDGTNRVCSVSMDGVHWYQIHTIGRTDFMTATEVGFFVKDQSASYAPGMSLLSWVQS